MKEQGRGSIVNLTSRSALGVTGQSTYSTVKGAAMSTTFSWALELLPYGVRVNALSPGAFTRAHEMAEAAGTYKPTNRANAVSPEVVAPAVVYLLSDLSSRITGQIVAMLGPRLGLTRHPRVVEHLEQREQWTPEEIGQVIERVYGAELQPIGVEATEYQLSSGVTVR
jgi:short-subunit dehydrogenase